MRWPWRRDREDDLEREIRSHLECEADEQRETGISPRDARYAALRIFGNTARVKEEVREMWGWAALEQLMQDVRYAVRGMRQNAGFTTVAVMSLALGIGAATAVFGLLNAVVLRPLPVREPDRLVVLQPELRGKRFVLFNPIFEEVQSTQKSLAGTFAVSDEPYLKATFEGAAPAYIRGSFVSGTYFDVLGVSAAAGRLLGAHDDTPSAECVVVISHALWKDRFGGKLTALGARLRLREKYCTVIGVTPARFTSHQPGYLPDVWAPLRPLTDPKLLASRSMAFYSGVMGRLRPESTMQSSQTELTSLYQRIMAAHPSGSPHPGQTAPGPADFRLRVEPGAQGLDAVRRRFGQPLLLVMAVVAVVLVIAALNVANLLLTRGAARTAELATRAALGASRMRLIRQLAIEGATLSICGGVLGLVLALLAAPAMAGLLSIQYLPIAVDTRPDFRVVSAAAAATIFSALLAGVFPALRLSAVGLRTGMASAGRTTSTRSGQRVARTLVAGQLALSLVLVSSAGLLLRTIVRVMAVDPGFDKNDVLLLDVRDTEPAARFGETDPADQKKKRAALYQALDQRLNTLSGVRSAALSWLGLFGGSYVGLNLYDTERPKNQKFTLVDYISPRYFEAAGMQILRGRGFTDSDREGAPRVAVVNEAFVRERIGGTKEAIGSRFVMTYADDLRPFSIAGIVRDSKYNDLREPKTEPMMWVPLSQVPVKISSITLRIQPGTSAAITRGIEQELKAASEHLMVRKTTTLSARMDQATARERLMLKLSLGFGGLALLMAAIGLYGTVAYAVTRRTPEIGVRLALGAQPGSVLRLVLRDSLSLVAWGILIGVPLSLAAGYSLRTFLFGVTAYDVATLSSAVAVLAGVAVFAALWPARRASRIDPILALKYE